MASKLASAASSVLPFLGPTGQFLGGAAAAGSALGGMSPTKFDFDKIPKSNLEESAWLGGIFGTQGNYNPFGLGYQPLGGFPTNENLSTAAAQQPPINPNLRFRTNAPITGTRDEKGINTGSVNAQTPYEQKVGATTGPDAPYGGVTTAPYAPNKKGKKNQKNLSETAQSLIEQGNVPFLDQLNMQSAGLGNLGQAFGNAQGFATDSKTSIDQLSQLAAYMQAQNESQNKNLEGTVNENASTFGNFFNQNLNDFSGFDKAVTGTDVTGDQAALRAAAGKFVGEAGTNIEMGRDIASSSLDDKDLFKSLLLEDRGLTQNLITQAQSGNLPASVQALIDETVGKQFSLDNESINSGEIADQLNQRYADAQAISAKRGLGTLSSPLSQERVAINKETQRQRDLATDKASLSRSQLTLDALKQAASTALTGADIQSKSGNVFASQFAPLLGASASGLNASTAAIGAGTQAAGLYNDAGELGLKSAATQGNLLTAKSSAASNAANSLTQNQQVQNSGLAQVAQNLLAGNQATADTVNASGTLATNNIAQQLGLGQLGLATQGQGMDQILAMLQALATDKNTRQSVETLKSAANAGVGGSVGA